MSNQFLERKEDTDHEIGLGTVLFIVLLIQKINGTLEWSWFWITLPIWFPHACRWFCNCVLFVMKFRKAWRDDVAKSGSRIPNPVSRQTRGPA